MSPSRAAPWKISVAKQAGAQWNEFVAARPSASVYYLSAWTSLANTIFGHQCWFVEARDAEDQLIGILPVVQQKSLLGNFATSVAFFNSGGPLSDCAEVDLALMEHARTLAKAAGCSYLELRDVRKRECDWPARTDKVSMVRSLPATFEELSKQLGSKLRSQARRADRESPTVRTGGIELIDDFYAVFAANMRDLGTPVYPKRFFSAIVTEFPQLCRIVVIDDKAGPAAAGFLVIYNGRAEIPWASCTAAAKPLGYNMKLYWEVLRYVIEQGCSTFDFGRSSVDAGTYKFKEQWGPTPVPLYWYRWERNPAALDARHDGERGKVMQYASAMWQRLPLGIANTLGPFISPHLPW